MKYYIMEFNKNWADEFDYQEFSIITEMELEYIEHIMTKYKDIEVDIYFGTNEGWEED